MSEPIRVMVVDDLQDTRKSVGKMLQFDQDVKVIGEAESGAEAIELARKLQPDIILMDVNMPDMDGITATRAIVQAVPAAQIIIMSVQSDTPYLRRAMVAGARAFLMKPFSLDELHRNIHEVHSRRPQLAPAMAAAAKREAGGTPAAAPGQTRPQHVVAVFGPKGGSGSTTIAINVAVALAQAGFRTLLLDGALQFGTVSVMLNMKQSLTVLDLVERINDLDRDLIASVAQVHPSGLHVLLAPPKPEMAELVQAEHLERLVPALRQAYEFVVADTPSWLSDATLALLDQADTVLLVTQQDLASLKVARDFLNLTQGLAYEPGKVWLVLNRAVPKTRISVDDVAQILKQPVAYTIPFERNAGQAADQGVALVAGSWRRQPAASALLKMADRLVADAMPAGAAGRQPGQTRRSFLSRLFGR